VILAGESPPKPLAGRVPRISRMMALAIRFDELIRRGEIKNFAELAVLGQVCRTRVSQIMNLLLLAPDIQNDLLFLPRGANLIHLKEMQKLATEPKWESQRRIWRTCIPQTTGKR
jgi:hypothetical protein